MFYLFPIIVPISSLNGVLTWVKVGNIVYDLVSSPLIRFLFIPILIIASLGAFSVFAGGILALNKKLLLRRVLILLGSGAGLIGFIFNLVISIITLNISVYSYLSFSSIGIIFALASQIFLKKR